MHVLYLLLHKKTRNHATYSKGCVTQFRKKRLTFISVYKIRIDFNQKPVGAELAVIKSQIKRHP
jgi:hypothetical protein